MYFFYVDESGEKNPTVKKDEPFVLLAVGFHEYQWRKFEKKINDKKLELISRVNKRSNLRLDLADAEIHSSEIRIPRNREKHIFLKHLDESEISELVDLYYNQFNDNHIKIFSVVVDKKLIEDYFDIEKLYKKVYELLLERVENFLATEHPNQNSVFVLDNTNKQLNRSVALKHSFFLRGRTSSGLKIKHVIEIPFFVESYLSNGVQLADLCAYNVYRAFLDENINYKYFADLLPYYYSGKSSRDEKIDGLKVFPENHKWKDFMRSVEIKRAHLLKERAQK